MSVLKADGSERLRYVNIAAQCRDNNSPVVGAASKRNFLASLQGISYSTLRDAGQSDNVHLGWHIADADTVTTDSNAAIFGSNLFKNGYNSQTVGLGTDILYDDLAPVPNQGIFIGHDISNTSADTGGIGRSFIATTGTWGHGDQGMTASIFIGYMDGGLSTGASASGTVAVGSNALLNCTSDCSFSTCVGRLAGREVDNCRSGVMIGNSAGFQSSGGSNTYVGGDVGKRVVGSSNTAVGRSALSAAAAPGPLTNHTVAIGDSPGSGMIGNNNICLGYDTYNNSSGVYSHNNVVAIGTAALSSMVPGADDDLSDVIGIGRNALINSVGPCYDSIMIGTTAGANNTTSSLRAVGIGRGALSGCDNCGYTVATGFTAGANCVGAINSVFIGRAAGAGCTVSNAVCIGSQCVAPSVGGRLCFGNNMEAIQAGAPTLGTASYINMEWNGTLVQIPCFVAP